MTTPVITGKVNARKLKRKLRVEQKKVQRTLNQEKIGQRLVKRMKERTRKGIDADLKAFRPLAASTIERRKRSGNESVKPLLDTQALVESIQVINGNVASGARVNTGFSFRIGAPAKNKYGEEYGKYHQLGTATIPQRKFLGVNRLDSRSISRMLKRLYEGKGVRP